MENLDEKNQTKGTVNEPTSSNYELASAGDRFVAALIDGILISVTYIIPFIGWLIGLAYQLTKDALPFLDGQSLGKKVMKLRVLDSDTHEPITEKYDKAVIRAVSLIIPIFGIVDAFMVLTDERLRFGDKWAKTYVVKWPDKK
jgi:uncharacterized RDD family membrane protein YckC